MQKRRMTDTLPLVLLGTVGRKVIRALAIILAIFLWFDYQLLFYHACYKQYKAKKS